jgi:hypothetical protein
MTTAYPFMINSNSRSLIHATLYLKFFSTLQEPHTKKKKPDQFYPSSSELEEDLYNRRVDKEQEVRVSVYLTAMLWDSKITFIRP